tara:strand:+ start:619 stop:1035 length:417 start_codon:yes stop_codon:yes gene_type:complete
MKWNEKTPKQYDAYATLVMGGENDKEVHLTEDEFSVLWCCLDTVKQLIDEVPGPNDDWPETQEEWQAHLEGLRSDRQLIVDTLHKVNNTRFEPVDIEPIKISELDLKRLEKGLVSPEELLEQKKRQIINENIKELTDG